MKYSFSRFAVRGLFVPLFAAVSANAGVVGSGTAASCTQAALDAQIQLGGTVTFNCGGAVSIAVSQLQIAATNPTVIVDGGGNVTLDGGTVGPIVLLNATAANQANVTFRNMTFTNGIAGGPTYLRGGAIQNMGVLSIDGVTFSNNSASANGGAIYEAACTGCLAPSATIGYSNFNTNHSTGGRGGAIAVLNGTLAIHDTNFAGNTASSDGGAIHLNQGSAITFSLSNGHFNANGLTSGNGGAISAYGPPGATYTIDSSTFTNNYCDGAGHAGGAIYVNDVPISIVGTLFQGNQSKAGSGGALFGAAGAVLTIQDSTFNTNSASTNGAGAVGFMGTASSTVQRCTFFNNTASGSSPGGAIIADAIGATVGIENSTISGNNALGGAGSAAGLYVQGGTADLRNVTVTLNTANVQGGIQVGAAGTLLMRNSIVAGNVASGGGNQQMAVVTGGVFTSGGYNYIGDGTGLTITPTDYLNNSPNLGALANNGGPTFGNVVVVGPTYTHLPNAGSFVIDTGNPAGCLALSGATLTKDQRNYNRPFGTSCDIGSVEAGATTPVELSSFRVE